MKTARDVIANVPDFWMDGRGEDAEGMELGEHNADRIIAALNDAGYIVAPASLVDASRAPGPQD